MTLCWTTFYKNANRVIASYTLEPTYSRPWVKQLFHFWHRQIFFFSPTGPDWPCNIYQELMALHKVARALSLSNTRCQSSWFVCLYHYSRRYSCSNKKQRYIYIITTQNFSTLDSVSATIIRQKYKWHSLANITSADKIKPICYWPITNRRGHSERSHFTNVTHIDCFAQTWIQSCTFTQTTTWPTQTRHH
jgi:hypothetical protein